MNGLELLVYTATLAIIDSFDPCFYALLTSILLSTLMISPRYAFKAGVVFLSAIYIGYLLIGLLIRYISLSLPPFILVGFLLVYGSLTLLMNILNKGYRVVHGVIVNNDGLVCKENDIPCKIISVINVNKYITRGLATVFLLGLLSSFTILPCSAQLYIVFHATMLNYGALMGFLLTLFYVAVFILPPATLFIMFITASRSRRVFNTLLRHERLFKITGSLIMITVGMYLLYTRVF
ncbi:MAG: hypothetical protein QXE81_03945 [Desulfurococcaceae archaeon]